MDNAEWEWTYSEDSSKEPDCVAAKKAQGWQVVGSLGKGWIFKRKLERKY